MQHVSSELRTTTSLLINARLYPCLLAHNIVHVRVSSASLKIWKELHNVTTDGGHFRSVTAISRRMKRVPENSVEIYAFG